MNNQEQLFDLLNNCSLSTPMTKKDSMFINGCIEFYKVTKDVRLFTMIRSYVDENLGLQPTESIGLLRAYRFLMENTKEEVYQKKIQEIMQQVIAAKRENGILFHEDGSMLTACEAYELFPVYAWYETHYNKKEHYLDIMNQLRFLNDQILVKNRIELYERCTFMMALSDTILEMSEEIYEYYALLKNWLKESVHKKLDVVNSDCLRVAYSVLRGCESKALLPEKYEATGRMMLEKAWQKLVAESSSDKEEVGILLMTSTLARIDRMEQAYGI